MNLNLHIKEIKEDLKELKNDFELLKKGTLLEGVCIIRYYIEYNKLEKIVGTNILYEIVPGDSEAYLKELVEEYFIEVEPNDFKRDILITNEQLTKEEFQKKIKEVLLELIEKKESILEYLEKKQSNNVEVN